MKVLVITRGSWSRNNNIGNTIENLFSLLPNYDFFNLALKDEEINSDVCQRFFVISEKNMCSHILSKDVGREIFSQKNNPFFDRKKNIYDYANTKYSSVFLKIIRELIWKNGKWKNKALDRYLDDIKPDIVFMPVFNCWYPFDVLEYVVNRTRAKVILFHADDNLSIPNDTHGIIFKWYRKVLKRKILKIAQNASNVAISESMANEYTSICNKPFDIIYKSCNNIATHATSYTGDECFKNARFLYTGNVGVGRWNSLILLGKELMKYKDSELAIYTANFLSKKQIEELSRIPSVRLYKPVPNNEVVKLQRDADFLVFVESFEEIESDIIKYSFSTKITDYLECGKCIIALGNGKVSAIQYFLKNHAAIVIDKPAEVECVLREFSNQPRKLTEIATSALLCAINNHSPEKIKTVLNEIFIKAVAE